MTVVRNRALRGFLLALGFLFVGMGFAGVFIPGIPTTGPILLAAFFFSKSSDRFDQWIVTNRFFGSIVQDWRANRGFTVRAKAIAVIAIIASFAITTIFFINGIYIRAAFWALAVGIAAYVITRPTKVDTPELTKTANS